MGFQVALELPNGISLPDAYAAVQHCSFDIPGKVIRFVFNVYASKALKDADKKRLYNQEVQVVIEGANATPYMDFSKVIQAIDTYGPRKVAYVVAKHMPEFTSAIDVLADGQTAATDADVGLV